MDITEQLTHESRIALAAAAEITRLRAESAHLRAELDEYNRANDALGVERDRLRAENERLKGALQEIADTPATPANHDLVAVIMLAQYTIRDGRNGPR